MGDLNDNDRERAAKALEKQVGLGRLTLGEFSDLSGRIWASTTAEQINSVLAEAGAVPETGTPIHAEEADAQAVIRRETPAVAIRSVGPVKGWFDNVERKGRWDLTHGAEVFTLMGDIYLDIREAVIDSEVTELKTNSVMGNTRILIPPGVRVELSGNRIMGSLKTEEGRYSAPYGPMLRIQADSFMGDVKLRVLEAGARVPKNWKWF